MRMRAKTKNSNAHGYTDVRQMAKDFAQVIIQSPDEQPFIEWLKFTEVEEILRECHNLTSHRRFFAKKVTRRVDGHKQNGYRFWWQDA